MSYCDLPDIEARLRGPGLDAESTPSADEAEDMIDGIAADMNAALSYHGVTVPVDSPQSFVVWLRELNTVGAAASVLMARQADATGLNSSSSSSRLEARYQQGLARLWDGTAIPAELRVATASLPTALHIQRPDADPVLHPLRKSPFAGDFQL